MIAGLLLYLGLPLVAAVAVYFLRRWISLSALLAVGTSLGLGIMAIVLPFDEPVQVWGDYQIAMNTSVVLLGRELVMTELDRLVLAFLFITAAGIFALAWRVASRSLLLPVGMALLSLLSGTLLIRPLIYAALFFEIAVALSIFALQVEELPPTQGGLHYLAFTMLALPGLLVIHWLMDQYALTPDNTALLDTAAILMTISFALMLGCVPFHTWVPALADDSEPLASAFVFTISQGVVWLLLLNFLDIYPGLSSYPRFGRIASNAGLAMVVVGGSLAPVQQRLGRMVGYGVLVDTGGALIALGMKSNLGTSLVFLSLAMRPFGLGLIMAGLSGLLARSNGDSRIEALRGLGWKTPWSTAALVFGGLSVAGWPVSAGFTWRWALYRALMPSSPGAAWLLLFAGVGVMIGMWRALSLLFAHPHSEEEEDASTSFEFSEGWKMATVVALAIAACVGIGLFPQTLAPMADRLAEAYTLFTP